MGKFSLTLAQNLFEEEKEISKAIAFEEKRSQNPYWGLKDNRGWLSRYPLAEMPTVRWALAFLKAGGSFDSCGSWGATPKQAQNLESAGVPGEFAGRMLALLGRADYDFHHVAEVYSEGFNPQKRSNFYACVRGIYRRKLAEKAGVPMKSTLTFGWMEEIKFLRYCLRNLKKISFADYKSVNGIPAIMRGEYYRYEWEPDVPLFEDKVCLQNPVFANWVKNRSDDDEICRRQERDKKRREETPVFGSLLVAKKFAQKAEYDTWSKNATWGKWQFQAQRTSVGDVLFINSKLLLLIKTGYAVLKNGEESSDLMELSRSTHSTRQVAGFSVCKIADTWFVWREGFSRHIEGQGDLRSVINLAEKRRKRDSLILTLNDVRNDRAGTAGFCLAGIKNFLRDRMPFVYRMVAQYDYWADIPEEIMETEFHLASKNIFDGYSSPVN